jgi:RNA polymerase sigma-70 factor (ECF subfamily)
LRAGTEGRRHSGVGPLSGEWKWRHLYVRANGQPALAYYEWDDEAGAYLPFALNVLTLRGEQISDVTAFICRSTESDDPESYRRFPEEPIDAERLAVTFESFGVPARLD